MRKKPWQVAWSVGLASQAKDAELDRLYLALKNCSPLLMAEDPFEANDDTTLTSREVIRACPICWLFPGGPIDKPIKEVQEFYIAICRNSIGLLKNVDCSVVDWKGASTRHRQRGISFTNFLNWFDAESLELACTYLAREVGSDLFARKKANRRVG